MKTLGTVFLMVMGGVVIALSVCAPSVLSNKNKFLEGFVTHEILSMLSVIMTISIATIATIHIWFNELESKHATKVFGKARREINQSAMYFIYAFICELLVLVVRSLPVFNNPTAESLLNGLSLMILLFSVFTLIDIMGVVRALTPAEED